MANDFVVSVIGTVLLVAIPTAFVYWRNRGQLSVGKSYLKGLLHLFRVLAWLTSIFGAVFTALSVAALLGASLNGNWPWWSIFFGLGLIVAGRGIQRLTRFILNDPDWNNIVASKDR